jgi:hypothetical protein
MFSGPAGSQLLKDRRWGEMGPGKLLASRKEFEAQFLLDLASG